MIGIDGFGYRREFEQFCPLLLRCLEPKEMLALDKCFWNRLSHYHDDATISHNNENLTAYEQDLHARVARERRRARKVRGKNMRALCFLRPSRVRRSLARSLATRNGKVAPSP